MFCAILIIKYINRKASNLVKKHWVQVFVKSSMLGALILIGCMLHTERSLSIALLCFAAVMCAVLAFWTATHSVCKCVNHTALGLGFVFAMFVVVGQEIHLHTTIERLLDTTQLPQTVFRITGMWMLSWTVLRIVLQKAQEMQTTCLQKEKNGFKPPFMVIWAALFLCWLPYLIAFFPGCLTNDSMTEMHIVLGLQPLSNHHPIIHQWTIAPFVSLGRRIGSLKVGVALYSLFQMMAMSAVFAEVICFLRKQGANRWIRGAVFFFYALVSVNGIYSITMWKDVLFGGITTLLMLLLMHLLNDEKGEWTFKNWLLLTLCLLLFCIYRNNGYYAFMFAFPIFLLLNRKKAKQMLAVGIAVVLGVNAYQMFIFDGLGASKSSTGEMLSVPLQQIASTLYKYRDDIEADEQEILEEIFPSVQAVRDAYLPYLSDPVKDIMRADVFDANPARYVKLWARIGQKHPLVYLDAMLYQGHGYWYPDTPYWCVDLSILENDLGLTMRQSKLGDVIRGMQRMAEKLPVVGNLYRPAFYVWIALLACGILICKRRWRMLTPMLFLLGIWLTTLLSPVVAEFRYVYGIIASAPLCLSMALCVKKEKT